MTDGREWCGGRGEGGTARGGCFPGPGTGREERDAGPDRESGRRTGRRGGCGWASWDRGLERRVAGGCGAT